MILAAMLLVIGVLRHIATEALPSRALQIWDISAAASIIVCLVSVWYHTKSKLIAPIAVWWILEECLVIGCGYLDILNPSTTGSNVCDGHLSMSFVPFTVGAALGIALHLNQSCKNQT